MLKPIQSALISVFYKDGLEPLVKELHKNKVAIYSTGGTQQFIEALGIPVTAVESLTTFPSILGGRVKTLHPAVFGGILSRRALPEDAAQLQQYNIPEIDLVIVDLYPFEETVQKTNNESDIIEKIDIGGVSLIRAAGKNYKDVCILASKDDYPVLTQQLQEQNGALSLEDRRVYAQKAFHICAHYDAAIAAYFNNDDSFYAVQSHKQTMRYGENPGQQAAYYGNLNAWFEKLNGKELSFNNLVDVDAAVQLMSEFSDPTFAIIKHTNVCGIASRSTLVDAWKAALAGDPESAFGGILITNTPVDLATATLIHELFFEIIIAPDYHADALELLKGKKNRNILKQLKSWSPNKQFKKILDGVLVQDADAGNFSEWKVVGSKPLTEKEEQDLRFANLVCKHLKSNAIALVKDQQLIGKGCGQTSRIDALRQAIEKARQFGFDLKGAVLASDAFFPFDDCVRMAKEVGIDAVIQPGGSIRDNDSIQYTEQNNMAMVMTGQRHFKH